MPNTAGILVPEVDPRTGATTTKNVVRAATYGRTLFDGDAFDAVASTTTKHSIKWPFKIDLVEGLLLSGSTAGDTVRFVVAPDLNLNLFSAAYGGPADILNAAIAVGNKQITLVPVLLDSTIPFNFIDNGLIDSGGYEITVTDGTNTDGPYLVTGYTRSTGVVTLGVKKKWSSPNSEPAAWSGFANAYATSATIKVTRVMVDNVELDGGTNNLVIGNYGLDSSPIPAGIEVCLEYTNTAITTKRVRLLYHLLTGVVE